MVASVVHGWIGSDLLFCAPKARQRRTCTRKRGREVSTLTAGGAVCCWNRCGDRGGVFIGGVVRQGGFTTSHHTRMKRKLWRVGVFFAFGSLNRLKLPGLEMGWRGMFVSEAQRQTRSLYWLAAFSGQFPAAAGHTRGDMRRTGQGWDGKPEKGTSFSQHLHRRLLRVVLLQGEW